MIPKIKTHKQHKPQFNSNSNSIPNQLSINGAQYACECTAAASLGLWRCCCRHACRAARSLGAAATEPQSPEPAKPSEPSESSEPSFAQQSKARALRERLRRALLGGVFQRTVRMRHVLAELCELTNCVSSSIFFYN